MLMLLLEAHLFARKKNKNKRTERKGKLDVFTQEAIWIREGETTQLEAVAIRPRRKIKMYDG